MREGVLRSQGWLLGLMASCGLMIGASLFVMNEGLSVRAGDVEMNVQLTAEQGFALRFVHAES
ncbi:MAG: hypothetical protein AAFW65_06440 [Pseudomonadota bacterium]